MIKFSKVKKSILNYDEVFVYRISKESGKQKLHHGNTDENPSHSTTNRHEYCIIHMLITP